MKKCYWILAFIITSCSSEQIGGELNVIPKPDVGTVVKYGSLGFSGNYFSSDLSSKVVPVPSCSENEAVNLVYKSTDSKGVSYNNSLPITVIDGAFDVPEILLPVGVYTFTEIYLRDEIGNIAYAVPNVVDPRFPFAIYVDNPLPMEVVITENTIVQKSLQALCYTNVTVAIFGSFGFDGETEILVPLSLFIGECPSSMTIQWLNGPEQPIILQNGQMPITIPVPSYNGIKMNLYDENGNLREQWSFNSESIEGGTVQHFLNFGEYAVGGALQDADTIEHSLLENGWMDLNSDGEYDEQDIIGIGESWCN